MHYGLQVVTPPAAEPISINLAAAHCRIDDDVLAAEACLLEGWITAARDYVERTTGLQLVTATWLMTFDWFPGYTAPGMSTYPYGDFYAADRGWDEKRSIRLRKPPLQSVGSIQYIDTTGTLQTLSNTLYTVDAVSQIARLTPGYGQIWPVTRAIQNAVQITFTSGFGDASKVPAVIKTAMLMLISHWNEHREAVAQGGMAEVPMAVDALLSSYWTGEYSP
jgi:uncharacterized phiE125 gp8 family phage protein